MTGGKEKQPGEEREREREKKGEEGGRKKKKNDGGRGKDVGGGGRGKKLGEKRDYKRVSKCGCFNFPLFVFSRVS